MDQKFKKQTSERGDIYLASSTNFCLTRSDVSKLIDRAQDAPRQRARICSHRNVDEVIHEMFIVHNRTAFVRPHKHRQKIESMLILAGELDYLIFDDDGRLTECHQMSDYSSGLPFYHTTRTELYHSLIVRSEWVAFLEITKGPFDPSDTVWADWSPSEEDAQLPDFKKELESGLRTLVEG
jgi:cupin fold WbuC family metalloprotein